MKYRKDFVTNSSSSSFVCEICGRTESGFDIGLSECGFVECVNGHIICESEALDDRDSLIKLLIKETDWTKQELEQLSTERIQSIYRKDNDDFYYAMPEEFCPICQFIEYSEYDLAKFLEKEYKVSRDDVFQKIKEVNRRRRKLYDSEYIAEVCSRFNIKPAEVVATFKDRFKAYSNFNNYIR